MEAFVTSEVFSIGEVAKILQVPLSRVKNWTAGRPFKIVPRIRAASGKGSRNLFSLGEVYFFALVNQLHMDGLSNKAISVLLEGVYLTPKLGSVSYLHLTRKGKKWHVLFGTGDFQNKNVAPMSRKKSSNQAVPGRYSLDVKALVGWVNYRVSQLRGRD